MNKRKSYEWIWFDPRVIKEAFDRFCSFLDEETLKKLTSILDIKTAEEAWHYDSEEEFFADYRNNRHKADVTYRKLTIGSDFIVSADFSGYNERTSIHIELPERSQIESVYEVFEGNIDSSKVAKPPEPEPEKPIIFIGHGRSIQWRDVKDHLSDKHDYRVEAYEVGARSGHAIRDILDEMLKSSSFALLVFTGEDHQADGTQNPRLNVVHEAGLFQGKLGFKRALILLEDGCEEFTNIQGIAQIRFSKDNIKETFGEILATLKREFG